MRAKIVNEKFQEKSDPIHDMGIGIDEKQLNDFVRSKFTPDADRSIYGNPWYKLSVCIDWGKVDYVEFLLSKYKDEYTSQNIKQFLHEVRYKLIRYGKSDDVKMLNAYKEIEKLLIDHYPKTVNEKFTEHSDPIDDMGIARNSLLHFWNEEFERHGKITSKESSKIFFGNEDYQNEAYTIFRVLKNVCGNSMGNQLNWEDIQFLFEIIINEQKQYKDFKNIDVNKIIDVLNNQLYMEIKPIDVNEKFSEKGDPLEDMGIGALPSITKGLQKLEKKPGVGSVNLKSTAGILYLEIWHYYQHDDKREIIDYVDQCLGEEYFKMVGIENGPTFSRVTCRAIIKDEYVKMFSKAFDMEGYIKGINEKFTEQSDPLEDMGVGTKANFEAWLKKIKSEQNFWNLNIPDSQLMAVAQEGKTEFVAYLIHTLHADPNFDNACSIRNAAYNEHYDTVVELIKNGADFEIALKHCQKWNHADTRTRIIKALHSLTKT